MKQTKFFGATKAERQQADDIYKNSTLWDSAENKPVDFTENQFSLKEVKVLESMIALLYKKVRFVPSLLTQTNDNLVQMGSQIEYYPRNLKHSKEQCMMAYVAHPARNLYKIFINEDVESEAFDSADLHEKGHIYFNHTQNVKGNIAIFREELEKIWDTKLAKYFEQEVKNNPKNKDKIVKMLFIEFSNIAQDMEINSKLFPNDEWLKAKRNLSRAVIIIYILNLKSQLDTLSGLFKDKNMPKKRYFEFLKQFEIVRNNLLSRIEGNEGDFEFCHPTNKNWPVKMDWMTYMLLLVKDFDNTMKEVIERIKQQLGQGQGQGQGKGQGKGQKQGQGQGQGQPISQSVLDEYMENSDKESEAQDKDGVEGEDNEDPFDSDNWNGQRSSGGQGRGTSGSGGRVEFEMVSCFDDFTKFLRKTCIGKKNCKLTSDVLYNSNRSKFAGNVVVPRRHLTEKWMPREACFIIDVSGSVNTDFVEKVILSIVDNASGIDLKRSHIIFCDTQVVADELMSKRTTKVYSGGGTRIAIGIRYAKDKGYCKKSSDYLFVISDLQDDLNEWVDEAEKISCKKFAVGYGYQHDFDYDGTPNCFEYCSGSDSEFARRWNNQFKTVFINTSQIEEF